MPQGHCVQDRALAGARVPESDTITTNLGRHAAITRQSVARCGVEASLERIGRADPEAARAEKPIRDIRVLGLAMFGPDVTPELARETIGTVSVLGNLQADPAVRAALPDRLR